MPPKNPYLSISSVRAPLRAAATAAITPLEPAPATITSKRSPRPRTGIGCIQFASGYLFLIFVFALFAHLSVRFVGNNNTIRS
jgi:hypothetical protein